MKKEIFKEREEQEMGFKLKRNKKIENIEIKEKDYAPIKKIVERGCNLDAEGMDYLEFYGYLSLLNAMGVPMSKIHILNTESIVPRNLEKELPCTLQFQNYEFVVW